MAAAIGTKSELSSRNAPAAPPSWVRTIKNVIWVCAWLTVAFYAMVWIIKPLHDGKIFYGKINDKFENNKQWSHLGVSLLMMTGPFVVLALLACATLELDKAYPPRITARKQRLGWLKRAYHGLWTQPLVVRGPLGMMTAIDIVAFGMVVFVTLWIFFKYSIARFKLIDAGKSRYDPKLYPKMTKQMQKFEYSSLMLGYSALVPLALLWVPVARGSPILKLIDIPFEHAVKHHIWIGHWTLLLLTAHGLSYGIYYGVQDEFHLFHKWQRTGIANLPGLIALLAGLVMWPTSLSYIRRRFFNIFFGIHQLYLIFFIFAVFHLGPGLTGYFLGGSLLFFIDRFLRCIQSRKAAKGITGRVLPTGIIELYLPVSPGLSYNAMSFMFLNTRRLARLEWHPFSTASTPLDNTNSMCILIKPLGDWTKSLRTNIEQNSTVPGGRCPLSMNLFTEGPYGHESNFFLRYKHLFLVAGGIGVTPFMAIIQDILYRHQMNQVGLPTTVDLIWCVRKTSELQAFKDLFCDPARIFHKYGSNDSELLINVKIYLTSETGGAESVKLALSNSPEMDLHTKTAALDGVPMSYGHGVMAPSTGHGPGVDRGGSGSNLMLMAGMIIASCLGVVLFSALFRVYVYLPNTDTVTYERELAGYYEAPLFLLTIVIGVVIFGGAVVFGAALATRFSAKKAAGVNSSVADQGSELHHVHGKDDVEETGRLETLLDRSTIAVGIRPNFPELMAEIRQMHDNFGGAEVGVLVCGPEAMAESVAKQCRTLNFNQLWTGSVTQFHYHSVSFDL